MRDYMCCKRSVVCLLDNLSHVYLRGWSPRWLCDWHDRSLQG